MDYALLGDIHSSKEDLEKVLAHILEKAPTAEIVGTGDLYECIISKKEITNQKYDALEEVMAIPEGFIELLTFQSVSGNQEDRILYITETEDPLRLTIAALPETIEIGDAQIIHGHQWEWGGEPWTLIHANTVSLITFFGHSHQSSLTINGKEKTIDFEIPYSVKGANTLINVGAVTQDKEWVLYDSLRRTITFMKA